MENVANAGLRLDCLAAFSILLFDSQSMKNSFLFLLLIFVAAFSSSMVFAQDANDVNQGILGSLAKEEQPQNLPTLQNNFSSRFLTKVIFETKFDDHYQTTNRADEYKDTTAKLRVVNKIQITDVLSLNTRAVLRTIDNNNEISKRSHGGDRTFENMGIILRELNLVLDYKKYAILAGKFNLNFGNAWAWNRGLWIQDLATNYRQTEKLGFSGVYRLGDAKKTGQYNFTFSTFTNDRKNFDNSLMVSRDSSSKSDGRAGDTRSLRSYNAALDVIFDFAPREKLTYHFAYLNMGVNKRAAGIGSKAQNQKSYVLNMNYKYPLENKMLLDGVIEYVNTKNLLGNSDFREQYLTLNLITKFDDHWSILLGNSRRNQRQIAANGFDQNLSEISFGYEFLKTTFFDKLTIQAGYQNMRTDYKTSLETKNGVGLLVRYYKDF